MQPQHRAARAAGDRAGVRQDGRLESTLPPRYRRHAWLAVAALAVFMLLYAALAGWFLRTAWRLSFGGSGDAGGRVLGFLAAACAAVLAAFMIKGLFFIRRGKPEGLVELTPAEQPRLFKFLHQLADEAGAPRPHKVYASARVNAAVFYDLSLLNFLLPSRKNLEIGLSLVNALTLGEVRAVLAHEFGHFAQRSMAVGRWVYIAHQITAQLVGRRDKLDGFVDGLSRMDLRIAWIGWILQTIVWAIRSLIDLAFRGVYLMQQALSREMELQADLVAVSLTGSDALVHALSKLGAADDSFDRVVAFAEGEQARGRPVADLFELHAHQVRRMAQVLDDPLYGRVPMVPLADPAAHRVFKAELTQPPRMWQSHPMNHEREANAKKTYVVAPLDDRPAWVLFDDAPALRARVTRALLPAGEHAPAPPADSLARLDERFARTSLDRRYQGVYLGRSVTRAFDEASALWAPGPGSVADLRALYPKSLAEVIERLRQLEGELGQLRALDAGVVEASGGAIHYRGEERSRRDLPRLIERVVVERDAARATLDDHERLVHRSFVAAARQADAAAPGAIRIEDALKGLLEAIHYAEHGEAVVRDLQHATSVRYRMVTGGGKITHDKLQPLLLDCNHLHQGISRLHDERADVTLAPEVLARLDAQSWSEALGTFDLPLASGQNISQWLQVIDGWVNSTASACVALRNAALDELLVLEQALAAHVGEGAPAPAPAGACRVPAGYRRLLLSQQQQRQVRLTWWQRFLRASGRGPALLRLVAAGGIVGAVLAVGANIGHAELVIYDALAVAVRVQVGDHAYDVLPGQPVHVDVDPDTTQPIVTTTPDGRVVERFDAPIEGAFGTQVYNVAGASPLVRWTAVYGPASPEPEQLLGAPRLVSVSVDALFVDPPQSVQTKHGEGAVRHVLHGFAGESPQGVLAPLRSNLPELGRVALAHARWDADRSGDIETWFAMAGSRPEVATIVAQRLAETPESVSLHRAQQSLAPAGPARAALCARERARAQERPDDGDRAYLATRCDDDGPARDAAFVAEHARWPANPWLAYSVAWVDAENDRWEDAIVEFDKGRQALPYFADVTDEVEARILRYSGAPAQRVRDVARRSEKVAKWLEIEQPDFQPRREDGPLMTAYAALARGEFVTLPARGGVQRYDLGRLARLQAASDGAAPALVKAALDLPLDGGVDDDSFWAVTGLALRTHRDTAPLHALMADPARVSVRSAPARLERMWALVEAAARPGARALADLDLRGLDPEERGHVYEALVVALGDKAPPAYRLAATRLLFAFERPFFITPPHSGAHA